MKIRSGFVSNSSSSSFCIYGVLFVFSKDATNFKSLIKNKGLNIHYVNDEENNHIVGVGNYDMDIDHYEEDWEDYESEAPSDSDIEKFKELLNSNEETKPFVEKCDIYSATFRDG